MYWKKIGKSVEEVLKCEKLDTMVDIDVHIE